MLSSRYKTLHRLLRLNYSTGPQSFPFPKQHNPTPHQIFHLPPNASQDDIKSRYYELVRIYHPDTTGDTLSSEVAHARFQSISNAYNILRGKPALDETTGTTSPQDRRDEATTAARRAARVRRHRELYETGAIDERWKDRIILFAVFGAIAMFVVQATMTRQEALEEIIDRARSQRLDGAEMRNRRKTLEDPRLSAIDEDKPLKKS
ncbi:hypothetical protein BDP27DRAFT_1219753 [Rhodocollybia butyracea]|uniref:J domain-containing protein n=1 Tax=Rhodocollybia butyracea TaxID=206335 RepID=A0A9P5U9K6_9AGAR|nr:hypothetical protein BDP27DRAFT_1219753 [Rhodocollybia butyracea]